jgi:hypothetical protein
MANGSTYKGQYVTALPFPQLSTKAAEADTFNDFPTSLMSVGKTADDGNISIFTKEGVSVYKEEDVLITCKGEAIQHILGNEVSEAMKTIIKDEYKMAIELVPQGCHHRNAAEVAIRNFKAHFLSMLAGAAKDFPPSLWDRLLPQTEITLNLLRQSNATPTFSAYAHLCGPFNYNKMPLAPMGCAVQVHEKTDKRGTWAYHSVDRWYLSTSPKHYRTHRCGHIKATKSEQVSDTVYFSHKNITRPTIAHADKVMNAIAECAKAIKDITSPNGAEEMGQLVELTEQAIHQHPAIVKSFAEDSTTPSVLRVHMTILTITHSVLRVQRTETAQRLTRSIAQSLELAKQQIGRAFLGFGTNAKKTYKRTSNAKH